MMRLLFAAAVGGLMVVASFSTPASAWQCMARSTNGAVGLGSGIILERAQKFAIQKCIGAEETPPVTPAVFAIADEILAHRSRLGGRYKIGHERSGVELGDVATTHGL